MASQPGAFSQMVQVLVESYQALLLSIPLVFAGIAITGSAFYLAYVRPQLEQRSFGGWISYLFPRAMYSSRSAKVDIAVWFANGLFFIPLFEICVVFVGLAVGISFEDMLARLFGEGPNLATATWILVMIQFLGFWFGQGIGQYVGHYAMHKHPVLWALHRAHHSAESANLFTFLRSHPLEHFVNGATRVAGTAMGTGAALYVSGGELLPGTAAAILWYNIIYVLAGFRSVDHLHIPVSYGRFLDVVIGSPIMHQVHHSAEIQHRDVNMAGAGYIFDWMFGTLYIPRKGETWVWGLNEDEVGDNNPHNSMRTFYLEPIVTMVSEMRGGVSAARSAPAGTRIATERGDEPDRSH
jgi:sterol desaturase/sphingolipid hydroxylase (fatty acid hydroxylase superfamily)